MSARDTTLSLKTQSESSGVENVVGRGRIIGLHDYILKGPSEVCSIGSCGAGTFKLRLATLPSPLAFGATGGLADLVGVASPLPPPYREYVRVRDVFPWFSS